MFGFLHMSILLHIDNKIKIIILFKTCMNTKDFLKCVCVALCGQKRQHKDGNIRNHCPCGAIFGPLEEKTL